MKRTLTFSLAVALLATFGSWSQNQPQPFSVVEAGIPEMRAAMGQHRITSRELVLQYLARIATYEDKLHAAITINPRASLQRAAADRAGLRIRAGHKAPRPAFICPLMAQKATARSEKTQRAAKIFMGGCHASHTFGDCFVAAVLSGALAGEAQDR